jgi:hypothetical protein
MPAISSTPNGARLPLSPFRAQVHDRRYRGHSWKNPAPHARRSFAQLFAHLIENLVVTGTTMVIRETRGSSVCATRDFRIESPRGKKTRHPRQHTDRFPPTRKTNMPSRLVVHQAIPSMI